MDLIVLISITQILVAIFLVVFILLQQRGTALGSAFGGEGGFYGARRGLQKQLYWGTLILGILFIGLALLRLTLSA